MGGPECSITDSIAARSSKARASRLSARRNGRADRLRQRLHRSCRRGAGERERRPGSRHAQLAGPGSRGRRARHHRDHRHRGVGRGLPHRRPACRHLRRRERREGSRHRPHADRACSARGHRRHRLEAAAGLVRRVPAVKDRQDGGHGGHRPLCQRLHQLRPGEGVGERIRRPDRLAHRDRRARRSPGHAVRRLRRHGGPGCARQGVGDRPQPEQDRQGQGGQELQLRRIAQGVCRGEGCGVPLVHRAHQAGAGRERPRNRHHRPRRERPPLHPHQRPQGRHLGDGRLRQQPGDDGGAPALEPEDAHLHRP